MGRLNIFKILKWGCRFGIQENYKTGNSELPRHVAKSRELDKMTKKEWREIKAPQGRLT